MTDLHDEQAETEPDIFEEEDYDSLSEERLSIEEANQLVIENQSWAESIARSVARAWNMDWKLDGLDGAAMEALIFCARRFNTKRGVPFRGYARRRIHEASTEQARKSRGWKSSTSGNKDQKAREVSYELFNIFPELRVGDVALGDESDSGVRSAIRQLIVGASLIAAKEGITTSSPDDIVDLKKLIKIVATLDAVHQYLIYKVYWEGLSLRTVAGEWNTDGLNVIREHKQLLTYLQKSIGNSKTSAMTKPKVRPGLRAKALDFKKQGDPGPFTTLIST
jgi:DNA-directed RNA polymerase specialized sigma subunit